MENIHYIGLNVHKKNIAYCIKAGHRQTCRTGTARIYDNGCRCGKLADLLRANLLPEYVMMPEKLRELRKILR